MKHAVLIDGGFLNSLSDLVREDDMVHFVLEAVEPISQWSFEVNYRGTGSAQYPPQMLTGQTHPDHDTICSFRRRNGEAITAAFKQVLKLARAKELEEQLTADIEELLAKAEAA
jgi:transposase